MHDVSQLHNSYTFMRVAYPKGFVKLEKYSNNERFYARLKRFNGQTSRLPAVLLLKRFKIEAFQLKNMQMGCFV